MAAITKVDLQNFTYLPIKQVEHANGSFPDIHVATPWGYEMIKLKKESHGLFGGGFQWEVHSDEVIRQLRELESKVVNHLVDKWLDSIKLK